MLKAETGVKMEHIGHKIKQLDHLFKIRMDKNLEKLGVTATQMHVLTYLLNTQDEKNTQKKLSEHFAVKHSTMSGILNRLKEKELIEIKVDEENKKYRNIYLTEKAKQLDEQMLSHRDETEAVLTKNFTQEEIMQLLGYLDRLYNNLLSDSEISDADMKCFNKKIRNNRKET